MGRPRATYLGGTVKRGKGRHKKRQILKRLEAKRARRKMGGLRRRKEWAQRETTSWSQTAQRVK